MIGNEILNDGSSHESDDTEVILVPPKFSLAHGIAQKE